VSTCYAHIVNCNVWIVFIFRDKKVDAPDPSGKIGLHDAIIPVGKCIADFNPWMWIILLIALVFWLLRLAFVIYNTSLNWEIRAFYRTALGITDVRDNREY